MEQRHPIIRKILTGVPPPLHQAGQREANDRWSSSSSPKTAHHGGGGSVRERAKAYEQRYTGSTGAAQAALEVSRIPVNDKRKHGQDAARPQSPYNAGKTSQGLRNGNGEHRQAAKAAFPLSEDKENVSSPIPYSVPSSPTKIYTRPVTTYELPSSPSGRATPLGTRTTRHLSTPASPAASLYSSTGALSTSTSGSGRTVPASVFLAARERRNSSPRENGQDASSQRAPQIEATKPRDVPVQRDVPKSRFHEELPSEGYSSPKSAAAIQPANVPLPSSPVKRSAPQSSQLSQMGDQRQTSSRTPSPPLHWVSELPIPSPKRGRSRAQSSPKEVPQELKRSPQMQMTASPQQVMPETQQNTISQVRASAVLNNQDPRRTESAEAPRRQRLRSATTSAPRPRPQSEYIVADSGAPAAQREVPRNAQNARPPVSRPTSVLLPQSADPRLLQNAVLTSQPMRPTVSAPGNAGLGRSTRGTRPLEVEQAFEEMIGTLKLPHTVAKKMLALDLNVKTDMLKGASSGPASLSRSTAAAATFAGMPSQSNAQARLPIPSFGEASPKKAGDLKRPGMVKKMKSFISNPSAGLSSPSLGGSTSELPEGFMLVHPSPASASNSPTLDSYRSSFDSLPRPSTSATGASPSSSGYESPSATKIDPAVSQSAAYYAFLLKTRTISSIDPARDLKKLRVLLRNESLEWLSEWVRYDGYKGLLERLHEVLTKEWREEQHDDKVLEELLKCFRGLLMTEVGRACLASCSPSPFRPLVELLYSDKKPGDLATRQAIVEILLGLFDVFPSEVSDNAVSAPVEAQEWRSPWGSKEGFGARTSNGQSSPKIRIGASMHQLPQTPSDGQNSNNASSSRERQKSSATTTSTWESGGFPSELSFATTQTNHTSVGVEGAIAPSAAHLLLRSLLVGPPNEKELSQHTFIQSAHHTRMYKLWMEEIIGTLSDYFWVFCHSSNTYWRLENLSEEKVEEPKVPTGMTSGVEAEALAYCAAHLRLVNALLRTAGTREERQKMHSDLFMSGMEKVVLTLRKSSKTYYPQIHLELARYIDLCISSGYPLHPSIRRHIEPVASLSTATSNGSIAKLAKDSQEEDRRTKGHVRSRTEGMVQVS